MRRFPTVTQVLSPWTDFSRVPADVLAHAAERGTAVHRICAAVAQGLWVPSVPDECAGYVESFRNWFRLAVAEVAAAEIELVDEALGFAGHPDLICRIHGDPDLTLVDLKTPIAKASTWATQIAAYRHLAIRAGHDVRRVGSLRLSRDGKAPKFDEYTNDADRDLAGFVSALNAYRYFRMAA